MEGGWQFQISAWIEFRAGLPRRSRQNRPARVKNSVLQVSERTKGPKGLRTKVTSRLKGTKAGGLCPWVLRSFRSFRSFRQCAGSGFYGSTIPNRPFNLNATQHD